MPNVNGCEWDYGYLIRNLSRYVEDTLAAYESWAGELPGCELEESDHRHRDAVYNQLFYDGVIKTGQGYSYLYEFSVIVLDSLRLVRCIKDFLSRLEKGEKREGTERTIRRIQGNVLHADTLTYRNSDKRAVERWEHNKRDSEYRKMWREEELSSDDVHDLSRVSLLLSHSVSFAEDVQSILKQMETDIAGVKHE